jgi:histone H3/H4
MSTADAALIALGERFERRLLEYMDAWLAWAPLMRAARAEAESDLARFSVAIQRTGCEAAQACMSELENDMQPLAAEIITAPATSLEGLRAKALVALWEALPASAFHHGAFEFRDNGEASRSLFDAVAEMTTLMPMVRELEARLAADARMASLDATQGPARS